MNELADAVDRAASETRFSGVVRIDRDGQTLAKPYGLADRRHVIPNSVHTQFGLASGTKGLTALTVVSLIAEVSCHWTPARDRCWVLTCR